MKILIAGDWHSELHEEPVFRAFEQLGHKVLRFAWHQYFKPSGFFGTVSRPFLQAQNKYMIGPLLEQLNLDLLKQVEEHQPDLLFIYRGTHIFAQTLNDIRIVSPGTILAGYNNDDPFSPSYPKWQWRNFLEGVPYYDVVFAYRLRNLEEYRALGARKIELLRSWFIPERNRPVELGVEDRNLYGCDVVFVGHYENDERVEYLKAIARAGHRLRIWGHGCDWNPVLIKIPELKNQVPVRPVWGDEYNKALCGAKVALSFFSKLNRDTYTRRSFEIPASGVFMLSPYSDDLESLFVPGVEAEYFGSVDDILEKLQIYLADEAKRNFVAKNGYVKVIKAGHDVKSRMALVVKAVSEVRAASSRQ